MTTSKVRKVIKFVITETDRHEKGFTIYKITSMIFSKSTPDMVSKISIWKRYRDIKKLHAALKPVYASLHIKEQYPSFPKPKFFGRFDAEVIEERRVCAINFLEFVARYPALFTSDIFVKFFESNDLEKDLVDCSNSLSSDTSEDDKHLRDERENIILEQTQEYIDEKVISKYTGPLSVISKKITSQSSKKKKISKGLAKKVTGTAKTCLQHSNSHLKLSETTIEMDKKNEDIGTSTVVIHDGSDLPNVEETTAQYILIAAAHMSAAFRHEAIAEYEEAFTQYKLGISHLLNGVQSDSDQERRILIQEKITKYLQRAERLYNRHLNCNVSVLNKPVTELQNYKVLKVIGPMMLVRDTVQGFTRVIKTIEKVVGCVGDVNNYILRGKVPYMVQLHGCVQTETTVFLILQYIARGKLWDYVKVHYKVCGNLDKKGHIRSSSCDAAIQITTKQNNDLQKNVETAKNASSKTLELNYETSNNEDKKVNLMFTDKDVSTTQLLENAQKLLQSVSATLKKSNSIASRMNESECLLYDQQSNFDTRKIFPIYSKYKDDDKQKKPQINVNDKSLDDCSDEGDIANSLDDRYDLRESSTNNSLTDINTVDRISRSDEAENDDETNQASSINSSSYSSFQEITLSQLHLEEYGIIDLEPAIWVIPESVVRSWAAEIICALEALHQQDVIVSDLSSNNILINDDGHIAMTYVVRHRHFNMLQTRNSYISPELSTFTPPVMITTAADVWSFGVLLYELLTGYQFQQKHPGEFHSHSIVYIPDTLSKNAKSLLRSIVKYRPSDRLTIPEIKQHPFFSNIDWLSLLSC